MLPNAPRCPECLSRSTQWLPATSAIAVVDYFRCERCGTVWVVGDAPESTCQLTARGQRHDTSARMFLDLEIEAGLLFATMARHCDESSRRCMLKAKGQTALDTARRHMARMTLSTDDVNRLQAGLDALTEEIGKVPA